MKIIDIKELKIPDVKVIKFARFKDNRGYFTEQFRESDLLTNSGIMSLKDKRVVQANQSFSKKGVVRGLHFQWNPFMGKLVRTLSGHMVDIVLDIRKNSKTYGKAIAYSMPSSNNQDYEEWIWVPAGFAHGNFFLEDSTIEYLCTGEYSPTCESGINPFSKDIDWSLCDGDLKNKFWSLEKNAIISDKDKLAQSMSEWSKREDAENFMYTKSILVTGGSGLLGSELKKILPNGLFPSKSEFDITNPESMNKYLNGKKVDALLNLAAFISPPKIDQNPLKAIETNIIGNANVVKFCMEKNIKMIYVSTDYVFNGEKGNYDEEDQVYPINKYAWSKLGGECAVRLYDNSLIIRTTFGPNEFPFDGAFKDQWTSRESVKKTAKMIAKVLDSEIKGVLHVAGRRKTVYEYAKELSPHKVIKEISIKDMKFKIPTDTSLNTKKYNDHFGGL